MQGERQRNYMYTGKSDMLSFQFSSGLGSAHALLLVASTG